MGKVPDDLILSEEIPAVEAEVDALRERTQDIVAELERRLRARVSQARDTFERVKQVTDVRKQLKAHPQVVLGVSTAAALALGIGVYVSVSRMLAARKPINRLRARAEGYRELLRDPERALRPQRPSLGRRLLTVLLVAGATTLVRSLSKTLVKRAVEPRQLAPSSRRLLSAPDQS